MIVCLTSAFQHAYQCITSIKYHALTFLLWPAVEHWFTLRVIVLSKQSIYLNIAMLKQYN